MYKKLLQKLSLFIFLSLISSMLLPIISYATPLFSLYFRSTNELAGYVYIQDPTKTALKIEQGSDVTTVTYGTYSYSYHYISYDPNNVKYQSIFFRVPLTSAPTKVSVIYDGSVTDLTYSNGWYQSPSSTDVRLSGFPTIPGSIGFNNVTGSTYLPAGTNLLTFTTQQNDNFTSNTVINGIMISLPQKGGSASTFDASKLIPSNLELIDQTSGANIGIAAVMPEVDHNFVNNSWVTFPSNKSFTLKLSSNLALNHSYKLNLSSASTSNEIYTAPNGTGYSGVAIFGNLFEGTNFHYIRSGSIIYIDNVQYGTSSVSNPTPTTITPTNDDSGVSKNTLDGSNLKVKPNEEKDDKGRTVGKVQLDADQLGKLLAGLSSDKGTGSKVLTIKVDGAQDETTQVAIPGNVLKDDNAKGTVLSIQNEVASYNLPVGLLKIDELAKQLGADSKDVQIIVTMSKVPRETLAGLIKNISGSLVGEPIDFTITAESKGNKVVVNNFGGTFVERSITLPPTANLTNATAVTIDPDTFEFSFVPAVFTGNSVTIKRNSNSIYAIIYNSKSFTDTASHWAKSDIDLLASKYVIQGTSDTEFSPEAKITRAQFATLLVRALGLKQDASASNFTDVDKVNSYSGYIGAAVSAKLIQGFEDQTFHANDSITREQMSVMIARAIAYTGKSTDVASDKAKLLSNYSDSNNISGWAQDSIAAVVKLGIVNGMDTQQFNPQETASRAQTAVMLKRMLQSLNFIN